MMPRAFLIALFLGMILSPANSDAGQSDESRRYRCGNPFDMFSDDSRLYDCLEQKGTVILIGDCEPGYFGYIVNGRDGNQLRGLTIHSETTLVSSCGERARIRAGRDFGGQILSTRKGGHPRDFRIIRITFDGMVDADDLGNLWYPESGREPWRKLRDDPSYCYDGGSSGNVSLVGNRFRFEDSASIGAMCGTGLGVEGKDYFVLRSLFAGNGRDKYVPRMEGYTPWADGVTALRCEGGRIEHNTFVDNTDIDLVIGGGRGCIVQLNEIHHEEKFAFGGLAVGNFNSDGNHRGSIFAGNTIVSRENMLAMCIVVGPHPWSTRIDVEDAGSVVGNTAHGCTFNLVVEGVQAGEITGNTLEAQRGSDTNCSATRGVSYAVNPAHVGRRVVLQPGYTLYSFDEWVCMPAGSGFSKRTAY